MTITAPEWTVLQLTGIGVVPYSTRAATQTLEPINQSGANIYRDVDGVLHNVGGTSFNKYRSKISCSDVRPFAVDGVWPGKLVTVDCISVLAYLTAGGSPARTVVSSFTEGGWTFYYPRLSMMVLNFSMDTDEYSGITTWTMELEEV